MYVAQAVSSKARSCASSRTVVTLIFLSLYGASFGLCSFFTLLGRLGDCEELAKAMVLVMGEDMDVAGGDDTIGGVSGAVSREG